MTDDLKPEPEREHTPLFDMALSGFGNPFPMPHAPVKSRGHSKPGRSSIRVKPSKRKAR